MKEFFVKCDVCGEDHGSVWFYGEGVKYYPCSCWRGVVPC